MKLIVGLGNPGPRYAFNRHNCGYMVVDSVRLHSSWPPFNLDTDINGEISQKQHTGILLKPGEFMNNSGKAVRLALKSYRIKLDELLVIHDDIDLPLGVIRVRYGGSSGGHKGVQSIIEAVGREFWRVRIGINNNKVKDATKFVLENFTPNEKVKLQMSLKSAQNITEQFLSKAKISAHTLHQ